MAEMSAGTRHGRFPAVNLPARSPVVKPERIAPMPRPHDVRRVPDIRPADTPLPGTPPVPQKMSFAQKSLISLDFTSFPPQFPASREFSREVSKSHRIGPFSACRSSLIA
jgi:hypothetical protein